MKLKTRLRRLAEKWCSAHDRSLARLSTVVMNDGGFFERLRQPKAGVTDGTLEKFAQFFATPDHWPGDDVPDEATDFLHVLGLSAPGVDASSGSCGELSPITDGAASRSGAEGVVRASRATPERAVAERGA